MNGEPVAFLHGRILTLDAANTVASGMIVLDGRIRAVGDAQALADALPADAERVDLGGRVVIPGFVDAHCHLELATTHLSYAVQCFVPPHTSIADVCRTLRSAAAAEPGDGWLVGRADFSVHLFLEDKRPILKADLDAAVPDRPVVVFSGIHYCTLNTRALEITGLTEGAAIPRGSTIDLDSGRGSELWDWLPLPSFGRERIAAAIKERGASMFRSRGVTSIAEIPFTRDGIHAFQDLWRAGELPTRLDLRYHVPRLCSAEELAHLSLETGFGDEWLRLGGMKIFVDGAGADLEGRPGADIKWSQRELDEMVRLGHEAGLQVMMHVQSERAVNMALTALERALVRAPRADHRHRIEHMGDIPLGASWWQRLQAIGAIPIATPQFIYSYADWFPEANNPPLRSLRRMGFRVPGNSDSTGSQPEAANPFHGMWCAIARKTRSGTALSPDERIDIDDALRMFTVDAAFACHMDDRGTLEAGKLADFVVLERDPHTIDVDDLPAMPIEMTVIGGEIWRN